MANVAHPQGVDHSSQTPMILLETSERWILTPTPDPGLHIGSQVALAGAFWLVTWDSRTGFGHSCVH